MLQRDRSRLLFVSVVCFTALAADIPSARAQQAVPAEAGGEMTAPAAEGGTPPTTGETGTTPTGPTTEGTAVPATQPPTLDEALARLASPDEEERSAGVRALSELGDQAAVPRLTEVLANDTSERVRRYAVVALANLGGEAAMSAILNAARVDPSEEVRRWAEEAVRRIDRAAPADLATPVDPPPVEPPAVEPPTGAEEGLGVSWTLAEALRQVASGRVEMRVAAVHRLAALNDQTAVPVLATRMGLEENVEVRRLTVITLAMLGGDLALETVQRAAREDPSLVVQAAAGEALSRLGLPVARQAPPAGGAAEQTREGSPWGGGVAAAVEDEDLLGEGDVRLGAQLILGMLWRGWSTADVNSISTTDITTLSFSFAPLFGYFVTDWLELGLELDVGYGTGETTSRVQVLDPLVTTTETIESSTVSVALLPQVRAHIGLTDHVLLTLAVLLGYGYESTVVGASTVPTEDRNGTTADGFLVGPEAGLEIAVDHVLIPIWFRVFYRPWSLEPNGAPDEAIDIGDITFGFGTGLHAYF
jgi:hypothetical protein